MVSQKCAVFIRPPCTAVNLFLGEVERFLREKQTSFIGWDVAVVVAIVLSEGGRQFLLPVTDRFNTLFLYGVKKTGDSIRSIRDVRDLPTALFTRQAMPRLWTKFGESVFIRWSIRVECSPRSPLTFVTKLLLWLLKRNRRHFIFPRRSAVFAKYYYFYAFSYMTM